MKTQKEIEDMRMQIQEKISTISLKANTAYQESDEVAFNRYDREYAKLVAQYNILLEVLR